MPGHSNQGNRDTKSIDRSAINTSCHPVQIAIMRFDQLGIHDIHRIMTALATIASCLFKKVTK